MTCVEGEKARRIMEEVHSGSCKNHSSGRSLAVKIKRHGHYWPTMVKDCENFTQKCEKMLEARSHYPSTGQGSLIDLGTMLVHAMVHGHSRTHAQVKTKTILAGLDGFLLKMGQSRLLRKHKRHPCRKLHMEKYRLQTWSPIRNCNGQLISIYFDQIRSLLRKVEDTIDQINSQIPAMQRPSRNH